MSERSVIFTLLMDKPPKGKLPVLSVHSFSVRKRKNDHIDIFYDQTERMFQRPQESSLMTELPRPIFRV